MWYSAILPIWLFDNGWAMMPGWYDADAALSIAGRVAVVAYTPYGKPPADWRPE
jgi:hypothetical protein